MSDITQYKQTVMKFEPMNSDTEFLLVSSDLLQNGMIVLLADVHSRASEDDIARGEWGVDRARERNRWCQVSHLKFIHETGSYRFLATYWDGTQRIRTEYRLTSWFVKYDSVDVLKQKRDAVMELVAKAMLKQDAATYHGESSNKDIMEVPAKTADEILRLFGMGVQK